MTPTEAEAKAEEMLVSGLLIECSMRVEAVPRIKARIAAALLAAVADEREACAKIAEDFVECGEPDCVGDVRCGCDKCSPAAAIRGRKG